MAEEGRLPEERPEPSTKQQRAFSLHLLPLLASHSKCYHAKVTCSELADPRPLHQLTCELKLEPKPCDFRAIPLPLSFFIIIIKIAVHLCNIPEAYLF